MNRRLKHTLALLLTLGLWAGFGAAHGADEALVKTFQEKRLALASGKQIDPGLLSKAIRTAINESDRLGREGKYELALERLLELKKFAPLAELPSFDVQKLAAWLYAKNGDAEQAESYQARADAMRELLLKRVGDGKTPDTPIQAVMLNDIVEWARMQAASVSNVKPFPYKGRELQAVTHSGPASGDKPAIAYFELDARVLARANLQESIYAPIPFARMKPELRALFELARTKREKFLDDSAFPYLELIDKIKRSVKKAAQLDADGKPDQALAALREIEEFRPIEDIPLPSLISVYSFLNGKIGDNKKQNEMRGYLFGINQVIAHSGDALTPETAVHIIAIDEENSWLNDKQLVKQAQKVIDSPAGKLDVISAKNAAGEERDYYFNLTRMFPKYTQGLGDAPGK